MKNLAQLNIAEQIFTLSNLWSAMRDLGAADMTAVASGSLMIDFADDAGVDRAFSALIALELGIGIVNDPYECRSEDDKGRLRWRSATLCMGPGRHLYLTGPQRPILEVA